MLSFWVFLRNRYTHSIAPGCYTIFAPLLNLCYFRRSARLPKQQRKTAPVGARKEFPGRLFNMLVSNSATKRSYLFLRNFRGSTTQRTNRPTKAPAAIIAIILRVPILLICPEYHNQTGLPFGCMLIVCYVSSYASRAQMARNSAATELAKPNARFPGYRCRRCRAQANGE